MSNSEFFKQIFTALKSCPAADVPKHFIALLESYPSLEKAEQKEFAETLYSWAVKKATQKPLLFSYAKFTLAFSIYYREFYDEALPLIVEAQNLFSEQNEANGAALCSVLLGSIYRTYGNVDLALKSF